MRRIPFVLMFVAFMLSVHLATPAYAGPRKCRDCGSKRHEYRHRTAVGFHNVAAPVGVRFSVGDRCAFDVGVGFSSSDRADVWTLDAGVPITVVSTDKCGLVRALFRPGVLYENQECVGGDINTTTLSAELEGEAFLAKCFSVSAAFGVAHESIDYPGRAENETRTYTTGGEFTRVGMHLYLFR